MLLPGAPNWALFLYLEPQGFPIISARESLAVKARKFLVGLSPTPEPREEEPAQIVPGPYSNCSESTVGPRGSFESQPLEPDRRLPGSYLESQVTLSINWGVLLNGVSLQHGLYYSGVSSKAPDFWDSSELHVAQQNGPNTPERGP